MQQEDVTSEVEQTRTDEAEPSLNQEATVEVVEVVDEDEEAAVEVCCPSFR